MIDTRLIDYVGAEEYYQIYLSFDIAVALRSEIRKRQGAE